MTDNTQSMSKFKVHRLLIFRISYMTYDGACMFKRCLCCFSLEQCQVYTIICNWHFDFCAFFHRLSIFSVHENVMALKHLFWREKKDKRIRRKAKKKIRNNKRNSLFYFRWTERQGTQRKRTKKSDIFTDKTVAPLN